MFEFDGNFSYRMPAHFGGYEGNPMPSSIDDISILRVTYTTDRQQLEQYVPGEFELLEPRLAITYSLNRTVDWLAGQDYNTIAVEVPVRCTTKKAGALEGYYVLAVWEDKITTILSGREGGGIPKLGAQVSTIRKAGHRRTTYASFSGNKFLQMEFSEPTPATIQEIDEINRVNRRVNWFGWRYIPKLGEPGADFSAPTIFPKEYKFQSVLLGSGQVQWQALTIEQNPTQAHIISALAQLPVHQYGQAALAQGMCVLRYDEARCLS